MCRELKDCPFCGHDASDYIGWGIDRVGCHNPECPLYCKPFQIEKWNTRPSPEVKLEGRVAYLERKLHRCAQIMECNDPGNYRQLFGVDMYG